MMPALKMHSRNGLIGAALILSLAAVSGCESGDKGSAKGDGAASASATSAKTSAKASATAAKTSAPKAQAQGGAESPQAVFDKISKAAADKDFRTYFLTFTKEAQDQALAGIIIGAAFTLAPIGTKPNPNKQQELTAIFKKHGFDQIPAAPAGANPQQAIKNLIDRVGQVKDRPGLFADLMSYLEKNSLSQREERGEKLENLKVQGDQANGIAVTKDQSGKLSKDPIEFRKVEGLWYISSMKALNP